MKKSKEKNLGMAHVHVEPGAPGERELSQLSATLPDGKTISFKIGTVIGPKKLIVSSGPARIWSHDLVKWRPHKNRYPGVCVVRAGGIGDLILLSSSLQALRKKMDLSRTRHGERLRLTLATKPDHICMFQGVDYLDDVIPILELENRYYQKYIDLRGATEPPELGLGFGRSDWETYCSMDRSDHFDRLCHVVREGKEKRFKIGIDPIVRNKIGIGLIISDTSPTRQIPPQYIRTIAKSLYLNFYRDIYLLGKTNRYNSFLKNLRLVGIENCLDRLDMESFISACASKELLITPDSAAVHIGGAYGIPTLALFGNIDPSLRIKHYPTVRAMYAPPSVCPKFPCFENQKAGCREERHWAEGTRCMRYFTPERIVREVKKVL